ncbi:MAG TPA: hypothetical protein PKW82_09345 [Spirochaetales bacterium]|nr:hypothetical protein [Spirochaetales bacterium]
MSTFYKAILVAYPDTDRELEAAAKELASALKGAASDVRLLPASKLDAPQLLAAGWAFFGVGDAADPAWKELMRVLEGVNLAGRTVGAFSRDGEAKTFLAAFNDSEPRTEAHKGLGNLAPWALSLIKS